MSKKIFYRLNVLIIVTIIATGIVMAQAQRGHRGEGGPPPLPNKEQITEMVNQLAKEISLTDKQKEKVLEIYFKHFENVKEKMSEKRPPDRKEMEKLRAELENKIKQLLNEEQRKKYEAFLQKSEREMRRRPERR